MEAKPTTTKDDVIRRYRGRFGIVGLMRRQQQSSASSSWKNSPSSLIHYFTLVVCMAIWFHLMYYSSAIARGHLMDRMPPTCLHTVPVKITERILSAASDAAGTGGAGKQSKQSVVDVDGVPCFVTVLMAANGNFPEPLQNMTDLGIRLPGYRYIVLTNDERLDAKDWEKIVIQLDTKRHTRVKTHVTYAKFLAWRQPALKTCRVLFVMDALNVPVNNITVWETMEERMHASPGGLLALLKPNNATNLEHTLRLPKLKKETKAMARLTHDWLASRHDHNNNQTLCLWTNFFAYDPYNPLYRAASTDFWQHYSLEMLTARDQPLWSYFVDKWNLRPNYLRLFDEDVASRERRPHVHVCAERRRLLCQAAAAAAAADADDHCEALTDGRYQYALVNVSDPERINCNKTKGGHTMSVLERFS